MKCNSIKGNKKTEPQKAIPFYKKLVYESNLQIAV